MVAVSARPPVEVGARPIAREPRRVNSKTHLIRIAEGLFATDGIDGVSLREIAVAAGQGNNNAVQYHFGSKAGLLNAIYLHRIAQLEELRGEMLQRIELRALVGDAQALVATLCLPHLTIVADDGSHPYASFLVQFVARHWDPAVASAAEEALRAAPHLHRLVGLLASVTGMADRALARSRVVRGNMIFLNALVRWDHIDRHGGQMTLAGLVRDLIPSIAAAILSAQATPMVNLFDDLVESLVDR